MSNSSFLVFENDSYDLLNVTNSNNLTEYWNLSSSLIIDTDDQEPIIIDYPFRDVCLPPLYFYTIFVISAGIVQFLFIRVARTAIKLEKALIRYKQEMSQENRVVVANSEIIEMNNLNRNHSATINVDVDGEVDDHEEKHEHLQSSENIFLMPKLHTSDFGTSVNTLAITINDVLGTDLYGSDNHLNDYSNICNIIAHYGYQLTPTESAVVNLWLKLIKHSNRLIYLLLTKLCLRFLYAIFIIIISITYNYGLEQIYYQFVMSSLSGHMIWVYSFHILATIYYCKHFINRKVAQLVDVLLLSKNDTGLMHFQTTINIKLLTNVFHMLTVHNAGTFPFQVSTVLFGLISTGMDALYWFPIFVVYVSVVITLTIVHVVMGQNVLINHTTLGDLTGFQRINLQSHKSMFICGAINVWVLTVIYVFGVYPVITLVDNYRDNEFCPNHSVQQVVDNLNWYNAWYMLGWMFM